MGAGGFQVGGWRGGRICIRYVLFPFLVCERRKTIVDTVAP
jgi:hypothetical protein